LICISVVLTKQIQAQEFEIKSVSEKIEIVQDSTFVKSVSVDLEPYEEGIQFPIIYDTKLESVSQVEVFEKKGRKFKRLSSVTSDKDINLDYINSKRLKSVLIPPETEVRVNYKIKCKELMYFTNLPLFSNYNLDTLRYEISVPNSFQLVHNTIYADSLDFFQMDSIRRDGHMKYNIITKPKIEEPDLMTLFGIYRNMKSPMIRTIVVPSSYRGQERKYMNDWYLNQLSGTRGLNAQVKTKIDDLTSGLTDPVDIIDTVYDYVRSNFKYVAIEIGMGAFVPSHVNDVFINKQGDCKDLSNFICEALNYKGIESDLALAATHSHISDCDFPSLSSANHVICIAHVENEVIALDPTDPIHQLRTPVQSLQNRTLLVVDKNGGEFHKMKTFGPEQNLIQYSIDLDAKMNELEMSGSFRADYKGISGNFLRWTFYQSDKDEIDKLGHEHFESVFNDESLSDLSFSTSGETLTTEGQIRINGKIFKDGDNRLMFLDFLPPLFETESRETLLKGTYIGAPFKKEVKLRISMDEPIEDFKPISRSFSENGIELNLSIVRESDSMIEYKYEFIFDELFVNEINQDTTNTILNSFNKLANEPIVFRKKSI
jgi:hypothetical protein